MPLTQLFDRKVYIRQLLFYFSQAMLVLFILLIGLDVVNHNLTIPITFEGDALHHLMATQSIIENGWWWHIPKMSTPFGLDMVAFPVNGNIDYALVRFVALFSNEPGTVINSYWFLTFVLAASLCTWSMRLLGVSSPVAFVIGILYAFIPHAFARNLSHLMLTYHFVPPICAIAISICRGSWINLAVSSKFFLLSICAFVGASYIYTAFFASYVLLIAVITSVIREKGLRQVQSHFIPILLIASFALMNTLPSLLAWRGDAGLLDNMSLKSPAESEIYGLKLRHLITPIDDHPLSYFSDLVSKIHSINFPLENENASEKLGLLGSIGFIILLLISVFGAITKTPIASSNLRSSASLNLAIFLLATIGGLGAIFNTVVSADIRAYNRIAVFTAFFSLTAIAVLLDYYYSKLSSKRASGVTFSCILIIVLIIGVLDQSRFGYIRTLWDQSSRNWVEIASFIEEAGSTLPSDAQIFQLPYTPYPNTPQLHRMVSHAHIKPSITTNKFSWSWPALSSDGAELNIRLTSLSAIELVADLVKLNFEAIWIDGYGYEDNAESIVSALSIIPGVSVTSSSSGRYFLTTFEPLVQEFRTSFSESEKNQFYADLVDPRRYLWGERLDFGNSGSGINYVVDGWSVREANGRWSNSLQSSLLFSVSSTQKDLMLIIDMAPLAPSQQVAISVDGSHLTSWDNFSDLPLHLAIPYEVHGGDDHLRIDISTTKILTPRELGINLDTRTLGVFLRYLTITTMDNGQK